jgi:hypothetical protein
VLSRATTATKPKVGVHVLNLKVKAAKAGVEFQATRLSAPNKKGKEFAFDTFLAAGSRDRGRIHEESVVLDLLVRGPYFKVPDLTHLTKEVVLEPPTPFLGSASLRRESTDKVSWVGDLGVNLPGFGVVPLAGPDAQVSLCADSGCRSNK